MQATPPRPRRSRAGGLAVEVERLGREGTIPAPRLTHNRRQLDEAERAALATYRAGLVETSQELRAGAGLEHELGSASATKAAMAEAVVADIHRLGPQAVVALCATHADAEEVADHIRARLAARGVFNGPVVQGPGWTSSRDYAEGDRVLLQAPFGIGAARLHNNSTASVVGVGRDGMAIRADDGRATILDRAFVAGARPDGRPNLSHGWARTVEGAQGGTWDQVHLLGTAALDRHTGYVGQSRGRGPTHTWNTRREPDADHGGRRVQAPSAADEVRVALERDEPEVFAAAEDPHVLDRQLRAERAEHEAVLARRPPSVDHELRRARATARSGTNASTGRWPTWAIPRHPWTRPAAYGTASPALAAMDGPGPSTRSGQHARPCRSPGTASPSPTRRSGDWRRSSSSGTPSTAKKRGVRSG